MATLPSPARKADPFKILLYAFIVAAACLPALAYSRLNVTDGFLYQIIAYVKLTLHQSTLETFRQGSYSFGFVDFLPGYPMMISLLTRFTGLSPEQIHFFPALVIFIPLSYYVLAKRLVSSRSIALLLALFSAYDVGIVSHYNVFAYTWSNLLYLTFLFLYLRLYPKKSMTKILALLILFVGSLTLHYAATVWMIIFTLMVNMLLFIQPYMSKNKRAAIIGSLAMPVAFVISFLTFNQIFYRVWLPSAQKIMGGSSDPLGLFSAKLTSYLFGETLAPQKYIYLNPWGESFGVWRTVELLLIVMPVVLWVVYIVIEALRKKSIMLTDPDRLFFIYPVLATAVLDQLIYMFHSGVNTRYVSLIFPILGAMLLRKMNFKPVFQHVYVVALLACAVITLYYNHAYYEKFRPTSYVEILPGSTWFRENHAPGTVLGDLDTVGMYLVNTADTEYKYPGIVVYDSDYYDTLINPTSAQVKPYHYVLVDSGQLAKPIHGVSNLLLEPIILHQTEIEHNDTLDRIYDDGYLWVLSRKR